MLAGWRVGPDEWSGILAFSANSAVVPAKAGTHNPREGLWRELVTPSLRQITPCGYGSRICASLRCACPGRQRLLWRGLASLRRLRTTHIHPRIPQQHLRGFLRGARHGGIITHEVLRDGAVDQEHELRRQRLRIGNAELAQAVAKPDAAAFLEGDRDLLHGAVRRAELGHRIHER